MASSRDTSSSRDKARQARYEASRTQSGIAAQNAVFDNAEAAKINLTSREKTAAYKAIKGNMKAERERTASRGEFIANRDEASAAKARMVGGITGVGAKNVSKVYRNMGK